MVSTWPDVIRSAAGPGRRRIFERGDAIGAGALVVCMVVSVVAADGTALKVVVAALGLCAELGMVLSGRALPTPRFTSVEDLCVTLDLPPNLADDLREHAVVFL